MYSYGPPHMAVQKQDDQHEHTFSNYVRMRDVVQKTCLRRWTIGKNGERGSGISVLPARHDDDDDDDSHIIQIIWTQQNGFKYLIIVIFCKWLNCSIWRPPHGTLTGTTTPALYEPGINDDEGILHISQRFWSGASSIRWERLLLTREMIRVF